MNYVTYRGCKLKGNDGLSFDRVMPLVVLEVSGLFTCSDKAADGNEKDPDVINSDDNATDWNLPRRQNATLGWLLSSNMVV